MSAELSQMIALSGLSSAQQNKDRSECDLSILTDPALVEDFSEIMNKVPKYMKEEELQSVNESVVITPTDPICIGGEKKMMMPRTNVVEDSLDNSASNDSHWNSRDGESTTYSLDRVSLVAQEEPAVFEGNDHLYTSSRMGPDNLIEDGGQHSTEDDNSEYAYSDSDFEDNLEERLRKLEDPRLRVGKETDCERIADECSDDDDMRIGFSDSDSDDSEDAQPLNPPQELDPAKLYALYSFNGPDPSHCQLEQDQGCILLNDQDSYWWLVKRCNDGKIGFAPAELLETFPERLARLNCWKNENMSSHSVLRNSSESEDVIVDKPPSHDSNVENFSKVNKSVTFSKVVSYAERYIQEEAGDIDEDLGDADSQSSGQMSQLKLSHFDKVHEAEVLDKDADDVSEVISDAPFNVNNMLPLKVEKKMRLTEKPDETLNQSNDELTKVFQAPIMPIAQQKETSQMTSSNSNYSISTIGEYSPSSSDWTNDSPQMPGDKQFDKSADTETIPSCRAIQDISRIVTSNGSKNEVSLENNEIPEKSEGKTDFKRPLPPDTHSKVGKILFAKDCNETTFSDSQNAPSVGNSSDSSLCMVLDKRLPSTSEITIQTTVEEYHPIIKTLYNPLIAKIDGLLEKIEKSVSQ